MYQLPLARQVALAGETLLAGQLVNPQRGNRGGLRWSALGSLARRLTIGSCIQRSLLALSTEIVWVPTWRRSLCTGVRILRIS